MAGPVQAVFDQDQADSSARAADVRLVEHDGHAVDPGAWDAFVRACDGSFLGSWRVVRMERLRRRLRIFDVLAAGPGEAPVKVGQCAVAVGRGRVRFLDRLHLKPGYLALWDRCAAMIVQRCGAATYDYGSPWNHEERCPFGSAGAFAAETLAASPFQIDRVEFGRWRDFADYRRSVSENIRRDYRKAADSPVRVDIRYGLSAVRDLPAFVRLRREVMQRNAEPYSAAADGWRHLLKLAAMGRQAFIATLRSRERCHAVFFGVRFGDDVYYLGGGTERNSQGFGSYLFLTLIEQWFAAGPRGHLYLGVQAACVDPSTHTRGNLLYRRKLRASAVRGTAFSVDVRNASGGDGVL